MNASELKQLTERVTEEVWNKGNLDILGEFYTDDFVRHSASEPDIPNLQAYEAYLIDQHTVFPDLHLTIDELLAEEDNVAVRWTLTGTHLGRSSGPMAVPPSGKPVKITGTTFSRFVDGKMAEQWHFADMMSLLQQIGLVPQMAPSAS